MISIICEIIDVIPAFDAFNKDGFCKYGLLVLLKTK